MGRGRSSSGGRGSSSSGSSRGSSSSSSWSRTSTRVYSRSSGVTSHSNNARSSDAPPLFLGIIFMIFGIAIIAAGLAGYINAAKYSTTYGTAIENTVSHGWNYTTYNYEVKGVEYTNMSQEGWEFPETTGKTVRLYYLKSNPNYITEKKPYTTEDGPIIIIFGSVFGGVGLVALVISINSKRKSKKQPTAPVEVAAEVTLVRQLDNKVVCPYCGTKYNKDLTSCPNCGASNK